MATYIDRCFADLFDCISSSQLLRMSHSKDREGIFVKPDDYAVGGILAGLNRHAMFGKRRAKQPLCRLLKLLNCL